MAKTSCLSPKPHQSSLRVIENIMSNGTKRQKDKKNHSRPKAGDIGHVSSIQRKYSRKIEEVQKQLGLFT